MRVEIYVQARMGSTRLPGKVMMPIVDQPMLGLLIERLKDVKEADAFAILTTTHSSDDVIVSFCHQQGVLCYRGSEEDVLSRYYEVANQRCPDAIVRITSDCPLIDPEIVDRVICAYRELYPRCDYMSNTLQSTYPRGMDIEIFSFKSLAKAFHEAKKLDEREHVTLYIYRHPELFRLQNISAEKSMPKLRLTVDTVEDLNLVRLIFEHLYAKNPHFRLRDVLALIKVHPDWKQLNAHIEQKKIQLDP